MARIILASELGGNLGHVTKLGAIGRALVANGHDLIFAVQRPDALRAIRDVAEAGRVRQAPIWPGLLTLTRDLPHLPVQNSYGDILAAVGMADSGVLEYLLRAWEGLFSDVAPDLLIAEFAPAALLAAAGRIPRIAVGTGFSVPPSHLPGFPAFDPGHRTVVEEAALLAIVNHAIARLGRSPLQQLGDIAQAEALCPCVFAELDPYADDRVAPVLAPMLSGPTGQAKGGEAIFVYHPAGAGGRSDALEAALAIVAGRGWRVVAYMPGMSATGTQALGRAGVELAKAPLRPAEIASLAGLVVTAGGIGLVSSALAAGLPIALLPHDAEKRLTARAVVQRGLGIMVGISEADRSQPEALASILIDAASDGAMQQRCRVAAPSFRARLSKDPATAIVDLGQSLLRAG